MISKAAAVPHPPRRGARCLSRGRETEDFSLLFVWGWGRRVGSGGSAGQVHSAGGRLSTERLVPRGGDVQGAVAKTTGYERKYLCQSAADVHTARCGWRARILSHPAD